jgi:uncharacterized membrane protein
MKYRINKIGIGIVFMLLSLFTISDIGFSNAEQIGGSLVPLILIGVGIYFIIKGISGKNTDINQNTK